MPAASSTSGALLDSSTAYISVIGRKVARSDAAATAVSPLLLRRHRELVAAFVDGLLPVRSHLQILSRLQLRPAAVWCVSCLAAPLGSLAVAHIFQPLSAFDWSGRICFRLPDRGRMFFGGLAHISCPRECLLIMCVALSALQVLI